MSIDSTTHADLVSMMIDFESGDLDKQQTIGFFQHSSIQALSGICKEAMKAWHPT